MSAPKGKAPTAATVEASNVKNHQQEGINMANSTDLATQGTPPIKVGGMMVHQTNGLYSLNDLHKAAGGESKHKPVLFLRTDQTQALVEEIGKGTDSHLFLKTVKGRFGGTYACRELVIAYAAWISAAFHLKVIRVFLAVTAPTPERAQYSVRPSDKLTEEQAEALRLILKKAADHAPKEKQGRLIMEGWSKLKSHFKVGYREIPQSEYIEAVSLLTRHVTEWEVLDAPSKQGETVNQIVARLAEQASQGNSYPVELFMPLVNVILARLGMVSVIPASQEKEIVDRLDRLGSLFHPLSDQFGDVLGIRRALRGLHPRIGVVEPSYKKLIHSSQVTA